MQYITIIIIIIPLQFDFSFENILLYNQRIIGTYFTARDNHKGYGDSDIKNDDVIMMTRRSVTKHCQQLFKKSRYLRIIV